MTVAVSLVRAYLELSGYFVLAEVPVKVHDRDGTRDVTDLDILAVRFPDAPQTIAMNDASLFLDRDPALEWEDGVIDVIIGEVKEGRADLNPGLRRVMTAAFALRRVGCCPEAKIPEASRKIAERGQGYMTMGSALPCRVRIVAFAGSGAITPIPGVKVLHLAHCQQFISERLDRAAALFGGVHFEDSVLGLLALQRKLAAPRHRR